MSVAHTFGKIDVEFKRLNNVRVNSVLAHADGDRGLKSIGEQLLEVHCNPISR